MLVANTLDTIFGQHPMNLILLFLLICTHLNCHRLRKLQDLYTSFFCRSDYLLFKKRPELFFGNPKLNLFHADEFAGKVSSTIIIYYKQFLGLFFKCVNLWMKFLTLEKYFWGRLFYTPEQSLMILGHADQGRR